MADTQQGLALDTNYDLVPDQSGDLLLVDGETEVEKDLVVRLRDALGPFLGQPLGVLSTEEVVAVSRGALEADDRVSVVKSVDVTVRPQKDELVVDYVVALDDSVINSSQVIS